jgi:nucleotide-binding universal stress UspA family protein
MQLRRILVPYDFSEAAGEATRYACDLAARFRAQVTVMHVLPPLRYDFAMTEPTHERVREVNDLRTANARKAMAAMLPGGEGASIRCEVTEGDAAETLIAAANDGRYDAIVMSTRGSGAFRRWFIIGSVTSKVLHGSERPVITSVHFENHERPPQFRRVLCAIDLGPQSTNVLCWGMRAARTFGATLEIAHVVTPTEPAAEGEEGRAWRNRAAERAGMRIDEIQRNLDVEAESIVDFGQPARVISELARARRADLLVLGRGVSQGIIGRLRANAYDIIRQCPCPVASI